MPSDVLISFLFLRLMKSSMLVKHLKKNWNLQAFRRNTRHSQCKFPFFLSVCMYVCFSSLSLSFSPHPPKHELQLQLLMVMEEKRWYYICTTFKGHQRKSNQESSCRVLPVLHYMNTSHTRNFATRYIIGLVMSSKFQKKVSKNASWFWGRLWLL